MCFYLQRARLLDNTERLENSSRHLEVGYRVATETEQIGQDILDNLHRDREKISRARQRVSCHKYKMVCVRYTEALS